jgi:hypothetical protein
LRHENAPCIVDASSSRSRRNLVGDDYAFCAQLALRARIQTNASMILNLHPEISIRKLTIGAEKAPLLVIDNFVADPDRLVRRAASRQFTQLAGFYPGLRVEAPLSYQQLIIDRLGAVLFDYFQLVGASLKFTMCHYSLVTTPADQLSLLQRIPHFDSLAGNALASIHYLFKGDLGGTAFYRHRKTGFEYIDESRRQAYVRSLESEHGGPNMPGPGYINGDTALFEQIAREEGVFNRMLVYRRNSLHSGCIDKDFIPDSDPASGRLSINSFIDVDA